MDRNAKNLIQNPTEAMQKFLLDFECGPKLKTKT